MPETNWPDLDAYEPSDPKNSGWLDDLMDVVNGWDN